jgi:hypothetical protein
VEPRLAAGVARPPERSGFRVNLDLFQTVAGLFEPDGQRNHYILRVAIGTFPFRAAHDLFPFVTLEAWDADARDKSNITAYSTACVEK